MFFNFIFYNQKNISYISSSIIILNSNCSVLSFQLKEQTYRQTDKQRERENRLSENRRKQVVCLINTIPLKKIPKKLNFSKKGSKRNGKRSLKSSI